MVRKELLNYYQYGLKEAKIQAMIAPLIGLVIMLLLVVILGYGGMRVSSGALTAGDLVAFIMYLFQIVMPMGQLTFFFTQFQKATGATERIISILEMDKEDNDSEQKVQNVNQSITVDHLSFSYKNGENVLKDISFSVEPGKVTAIVGPSGSGRTTLVIAHRLSTVIDADQILFFEKGKITGSGTHEELIQTHSLYREFATQQLRMREPV
ncbi:hypothetical protein HMPREF0083_02811 [Aneurinibacillus aneurinilyticus ATCC 12856]|uniref:ABC transmembrane type-1 domain-containing protein n=1 Tax=Aneurinibacillus aneurinilyticus ATCC 12856 TaxID=649747 RepID=U1X3A1_ANEAE|nr:hypothetical protein HMPREF0083_02811 [Aneurinibacillus aneurinilyticus ATCC 12856]